MKTLKNLNILISALVIATMLLGGVSPMQPILSVGCKSCLNGLKTLVFRMKSLFIALMLIIPAADASWCQNHSKSANYSRNTP